MKKFYLFVALMLLCSIIKSSSANNGWEWYDFSSVTATKLIYERKAVNSDWATKDGKYFS